MAFSMTNIIFKSVRLKGTGGCLSLLQVNSGASNNLIFTRGTSFFNKANNDSIWDSMTSVSNVGKKRGRAARGRLMKRFDIYKATHHTPLDAIEKLKERADGESVEAKESTLQTSAQHGKFSQKSHPLERGYAGRRMPGKKVGVPKNIDGYDFAENGFQSICLQMKMVARMTATQKNVRRTSALVVLGNGNGLAGYAVGKSKDMNVAVKMAKRKAALRLRYFEAFNNRTLWHNFHEKYHMSKLFAFRKHEGYGLVCHRVLQSICEVVGIKDIYVKVEGETKNPLALTTAFFNGLEKQKTHQEMADELGYNVVEYDQVLGNFPKVVARPSSGSTKKPLIKKEEGFDYETYFLGGVYHKREKKPFFVKQDQYKRRQFRQYKTRNQIDARLMRNVYGINNFPESK